jgi:hypothetical protein
MFFSKKEDEYEFRQKKLKEDWLREALIYFVVATENITELISRYLSQLLHIRHKNLIKFETTVFVYYRLSKAEEYIAKESFDFFKGYYVPLTEGIFNVLYSNIKKHLDTICTYDPYYFDLRINEYKNKNQEMTVGNYGHKGELYKLFNKLICRAKEYDNDMEIINDYGKPEPSTGWHDFMTLKNFNSDISNVDRIIIPTDNIEDIIKLMFKKIKAPFVVEEIYS